MYHVVTRGDGRRRLFHDEGHYQRFTKGLQEQVDRCGWQVIAYCWTPNHIHGLIRTPVDRLKDWVYGGEEFLRTMVQLANREDESTDVRQSIRKSKHTVEAIIAATAREYGVDPETYRGFRSGAPGRDVAAYLCRRYTTATLAELSNAFGLSHRDSSGDLVQRARSAREQNPKIDRRISKIEKHMSLNPESRV